MIKGFVIPSGRELTPEELQELIQNHTQAVDPIAALTAMYEALDRRIKALEVAAEKRGPSPSNPIPGAWPLVPAPVCAVCCGPHRTGDCPR